MSTKEKFTVVENYLKRKFPDSIIEQNYDFDRRAQSFKVNLAGRTLLLKVGSEFTEDKSIEEIIRQFDLWALPEILAKETELGVMATQLGLETFCRGT